MSLSFYKIQQTLELLLIEAGPFQWFVLYCLHLIKATVGFRSAVVGLASPQMRELVVC